MSGHKPFTNLSHRLRATPEGLARSEVERRLLKDMLALSRLREARGISQPELDEAWEVSRDDDTRDESEFGIYLSTLQRYVAALGGRLEVTAIFPDQTISLTPSGGPRAEPSTTAPVKTKEVSA